MTNPRTDEELIAAIRAGHSDGFDELYVRYRRRLYGYICRMVDRPSPADDLFQDIFLSVLRDRSYDPTKGRFSPWLFTVARNRCLMERRKDARRQQALRAAEASVAVNGAMCLHRETGADRRIDRQTRVRTAMQGLPEAQRQLLLLKQVGELTYKEIGQMLDLAEGTVKSRLHTAMKAFRQQLDLQGETT